MAGGLWATGFYLAGGIASLKTGREVYILGTEELFWDGGEDGYAYG